MPHYKDGQRAFIGDLVQGTGYHLKDKKGQPRTIVGQVLGVVHNSESCNIRVACLCINEVPLLATPITNGVHFQEEGCKVELIPFVEYGEAKAFELIHGVTKKACCENKEVELRPVVAAVELYEKCRASMEYRLFRQFEHGGDQPIHISEMIEVKEGDYFYCVPPACM